MKRLLTSIINFSVDNRLIVLFMTAILAAVGWYNLRRLPIDAIPDITNVQVQVLTLAPALSTLEVEQFISYPVESAMSGLPKMNKVRSVSRPGLSAVTIEFEDGTDIYWARQLIKERLDEARENIPEGFGSPEIGPISSGLGEIYQFEVRSEIHSQMELRSILDWQIAYQLRTVPGVVEVNTFGGLLKTYEVQIEPEKLRRYNLGLDNVIEAMEKNNSNAGGAYIERSAEALYIRGEGLIKTLDEVGEIIVTTSAQGTPVYIKDLGKVVFAPMVRQGAVTRDGRGEVVTGIAMMLMGENSREVVDRVKQKIESIKKTLPEGVVIDTFYDRTDLVRRTIHTVITNLSEGGALVVVILFVLLGSIKLGLSVALIIPLSMLGAFIGMRFFGISGNLMSLGAIDFGIIVDGAVVMIENMARHMARPENFTRPKKEVCREACQEIARPVVFGILIITIVYLPILTLEGIEGKMFQPMALTVVFALVVSLLLSLTLMPALGTIMVSRPKAMVAHAEEHETWPVRMARKLYRPMLGAAVRNPLMVILLAVIAVGSALLVAPYMGSEFIPELDEGAIALQASRLPSVSLEESVRQMGILEKTLKQIPEVDTVVSKTGRAEIATDPMGVELTDIFAMLKPHSEWRSGMTKDKLIQEMQGLLNKNLPGNMYSFSQPIELRMSELIAGVRSDVGIKIYGPDLDVLRKLATEVSAIVSEVPGAEDVRPEQTAGLPQLRVIIDRHKIARYGVNANEILETVSALGGYQVGWILEGQRRFHLQIRFAPDVRKNIDQIRAIPVRDSKGRLIPLSQLAELEIEDGPAQISREKIQRRINVELNVRGRDLGSFANDARRRLEEALKLPEGYEIAWGGQFENLQRASEKLAIVVPLALFLIFFLLYSNYGNLPDSLRVFTGVPFAMVGGIWALFLRDMPFSISAAVGFIALAGVSVLADMVMVSTIRQLINDGMDVTQATLKGAERRLRPVLMTALVASLGFVPMALSSGSGAEVQRPLATVVIGGLISSTILTLLVVPTLYATLRRRAGSGIRPGPAGPSGTNGSEENVAPH